MSDTIENGDFDVEAQETHLGREAEAGAILPHEAETRVDPIETLHSIILVIRSTELFKLGATYAADHISSSPPTSSDYAVIGSSDEHIAQDSGNVAAREEILISPYNLISENGSTNNLQSAQTKSIAEIVKEQNLEDFRKFGGVRGVAEALNSDLQNGLSSLEPNTYQRKSCQISQVLTTFFNCFLVACNNYTVLLLSIAAALSLIFGIKEEGFASGWFINGAIIINTIVVLVICSTIHNFVQERRSLKRSWWSKGRKMKVKVVRGGCPLLVPECSLRVGDVAVLQKGDQVPAEGIFIDGQSLQLDAGLTIDENKPFIFYGSRVINGNGRMIVTSTGIDTVWGEMMSQAIGDSPNKKSNLEACLHKLTTCNHFTALLISILIIIVISLRYKPGSYRLGTKGEPTQVDTILDCIKAIINGSNVTARVLKTLSVSLLGIMEGMPFVISVAIFMWNRKTLGGKASDRDYLAFVKMASVTTICSDKFGGLTEHEVEIDNLFVGGEFVSESSVVGSNVLEGLCDGIGTLFLIPWSVCASKALPLVSWAEAKLGLKEKSVREQCEVISSEGRDPFQECCHVLMEKSSNGEKKKYLHFKGPAKNVLPLCSHYYEIEGKMQEFDDQKTKEFEQAIERVAEEAKVMAYARKLFVDETDLVSVETNYLILLGMISLKETKQGDTRKAVSTLMQGGITTILASGDDVEVLKTIGESSGVLAPGSDDLALTAEEFRSWTNEERVEKIEKIRVMGNCLPSDRILLIKFLREKGKVVAFMGQRTVDAPALKQADIGLTFGTWSSELARESADISIWHDDFSFLVNLIENSRCFQENIQKFIQLEMIIAISSSLINFIAMVFWGDAPITAVRLLLLNLVVAVVGGLALLTGPATKTLMTMPPVKSSAKLITKAMWRNIAIQASYQTTIFVTLQHKGHAVLGASGGHVKSLIYNGFFMCQMFSKFVAREPEKKNIFRGLFHKNWWFWVAVALFIICQAVFSVVEVAVGSSSGLSLKLWGVCLLIALVSWLLDLAGKSVFNFNC